MGHRLPAKAHEADSQAPYMPRQPIQRYGLPLKSSQATQPANPFGRPIGKPLPLSPKRDAAANIQPHVRSQNGLLDTIKSHATQLSKGQSAVFEHVPFDENDLDDEIDLDFDAPGPRVSKTQPVEQGTQSDTTSWPASSAVDPRMVARETEAAAAATQQVATAEPIKKGKRKLPWNTTETKMQYGLQGMQTPAKSSALDMSASAMKNSKKELLNKRKSETAVQKILQTQSSRAELAKVFLSKEQQMVVAMIKNGKSVFFTGSAGTGKSVLMREAIKELKRKHVGPEQVAVCASTGLAACNIGGITLHSFAGVGIGNGTVQEMVKSIKKNKRSISRWTKVKVLIIDEISMIDADLFDKLESVARMLRKNERPWGGIQLVCTGDFFQLPPVVARSKEAKFSFESEAWKKIDHTVALKTVFRQKDGEFVTMLNEMRTGTLSDKTVQGFLDLQRPLPQDDGIAPTELFPTRDEVERANASRMRMLPGATRIFEAEDSGGTEEARKRYLSSCMAPERLELKEGAQVMLIKNQSEYLVNGSLGRIVGFMNDRTYTQCLDESGQFREDLWGDSPWDEADLADDSIASERKRIKLEANRVAQSSGKVWPLVKFTVPGSGDVIQLVSPESWKMELPNGELQAARKQVPLILAYAISIHKAQGQTIDRVKVDLGRVFEKGQAYVALSRAVSKDGLQILRFDKKKVMAHPRVAMFYRELDKQSLAIDDEDDVSLMQAPDPRLSMSTQQVFSQAKRDPLTSYPGATKRGTGWS